MSETKSADTNLFIRSITKNNSMAIDYITGIFELALDSLNFYGLILPLFVYTILLAGYGVFVWTFYRSISKRDLFVLEIFNARRKRLKKLMHVLKYIFLFPALAFVCFT